ncbi:MAG: cation transporter [Phycisphaerae bacterium]|nr:cation transporter [Phycisphaerae bacterium]
MNHVHKIENSNSQIRKITYVGIFVNVFLSIAKLAVGLISGSMALFADGIHSLSDMATDVAVLIGVHFGSKEPDLKHPYGHGRLETFSAVLIAFILLLVGGGMIYKASIDIESFPCKNPGWIAIIVALISIISKEILYQLTKRVAVKTHSSALYANAWHHRSDALSSVAVLIGLMSVVLFDFRYGDRIAAIAVGLMIILMSLKIIADCFQEFNEASVDPEIIENIENIISSDPSIRQWHQLRTRLIGREVFLDLHILVDDNLNITEAHQIAENLENSLHRQIPRPINIVVHVEPDKPKFRK